MSDIKLPDVPSRILAMAPLWMPNELREAVRAYAEQAVREALAAQLPMAWMLDVRKCASDPSFCWGNPEGIYASTYVPLALIQENNHE